MPKLESLGWDSFFQTEFEIIKEPGFEPARVAIEYNRNYVLYSERGELMGEALGKLRYRAESAADLPKVGDWVAISVAGGADKAVIHRVLGRRSKFSRKVPGKKTEEQVIATNIDTVFIVQALDETFSVRRVERYLAMAFEGGTNPVVVLSKADLCADVDACVGELRRAAPDIPVYAISSVTGFGVEDVSGLVKEGVTIAFIGPSGVGKSTLINRLVGKELQKTGDVRDYDSKGRHTTTRRELIFLPEGGLLIDTPGMREVQLWNADIGVNEAFADIEELAQGCKFSDCGHTIEIGCAVLEGLGTGLLPEERYQSYLKLQQELAYLDTRQNRHSFHEKERKVKKVQREFKKVSKRRKS